MQTILTRIFIVLESVSHDFSENQGGISQKSRNFKHLICPKSGVLRKNKKKKVFTNFETDFSAKIGNPNVFSAQIQVISKKKKKKKILRLIFRPKSKILGRHRKIERLRGGCFPMGGYFKFFTKNRPQKHQKRAILHTSQANGGELLPPRPPPGYATD